jgi:DNA-binding MarR family transcriptional regulator
VEDAVPGEPGFCEVCGRELATRQTGRPARFCSRACRQKAYRDRASGRDSAAAAAAITGPDGLLTQEDSAPDAAEKTVPHLSESELLAWRGLLEVHARLLPALDDELSSVTGLSLSEFDVLYQLWIRPGGRMRMKRLAAALLITPGGATRIVKRLEDDKLVRRLSRAGEQAVEAELTALGRERLAVAMDIHFAGVRRSFSSDLTDAETATLVAIWRRLGREANVG